MELNSIEPVAEVANFGTLLQGNRWFPFFPDILFYLKFYFLIPLGIYLAGNTIIKRKRIHRAYRRKLVRDHELEETFFKVRIS